jgi:hypothetical protein
MALLQKMESVIMVAFFGGFVVKKVTANVITVFNGGGVVKKVMAAGGFFCPLILLV